MFSDSHLEAWQVLGPLLSKNDNWETAIVGVMAKWELHCLFEVNLYIKYLQYKLNLMLALASILLLHA